MHDGGHPLATYRVAIIAAIVAALVVTVVVATDDPNGDSPGWPGLDAPSPTATTAITTTTTATSPDTTSPASTTTTTTAAPPTTTSTTTTTTPPRRPVQFRTLPPGSRLPSGGECAKRVRPAPEVRPSNAEYTAVRGTDPHDEFPRVDGDFTGTTDEILQWVACKWGVNEDLVRAQAVVESYWFHDTGGDRSDDPSTCHPAVRHHRPCPQSVGLFQVRWPFHRKAFEDANALRSAAYNADYTYARWRQCFEGDDTWLNNVKRGADYHAGDAFGCLGVWVSGNWYVQHAVRYIHRVKHHLAARTWEHPTFAETPAPPPLVAEPPATTTTVATTLGSSGTSSPSSTAPTQTTSPTPTATTAAGATPTSGPDR